MGEAAMNGVTKATLTANSLTYAAESGDSKDITSHMISKYEGSHDYHRNSYVRKGIHFSSQIIYNYAVIK